MNKLQKLAFLSIFAVLNTALPSNAFVDALELLQKGDKKVLLIGDRHVSDLDRLPLSMKDKEIHDAIKVKDFLAQLEDRGIESRWVLESSELRVKLNSVSQKLLFVLPIALKEPHKYAVGVFSDFRREEFAWLISDLHHAFTQLVQASSEYIIQQDAWSSEDREWLLANNLDVMVHDMAPRFDAYLRQHEGFRSYVGKMIREMALSVDETHASRFGDTVTLRKFEVMLSHLDESLKATAKDSVIAQELTSCKAALEKFKTDTNSDSDEYFTHALIKKVARDYSITLLDPLAAGDLGQCAIDVAANAGFLVDLLESQRQSNFTVMLAGGAHTQAISESLKAIGYKTRFLEGIMEKASRLRKAHELTHEDTPIDDQLLVSRLAQVVEELSLHKHEEL